MTDQDKLVTIVIPTYNSGRTISSCLDSIKSQTHSRCEVVIVDRFSDDETIPILRRYGCKIIQNLEKRSSARNIGASNTSGDYLMFIDSDMQLESTTVEECVKLSIASGYDSLVVPEISVGTGFWSKCIALEKELYIDNQLIESPCFFSKSCFVSINGYDEKLEAGEDWDITSRLIKNNYRIGHINSSILHNEGRATLTKLFRKKYYYGQSITSYTNRYPDLARAQLSPSRFLNKKSMSAILHSPKLGAGLVFMKTIEFSGLLIGSKAVILKSDRS